MKVAVGVIFNKEGQILITQRPWHVPHGGMWEFPGGKLENNEAPAAALCREIKEEVGLEIRRWTFLGNVMHAYEDKQVQLFVFSVREYSGMASLLESQINLQWVGLNELANYPFPEANRQIIEMLS